MKVLNMSPFNDTQVISVSIQDYLFLPEFRLSFYCLNQQQPNTACQKNALQDEFTKSQTFLVFFLFSNSWG